MHRSCRPMAFSFATLALSLAPAVASAAAPSGRASHSTRIAKAHMCTKAPVEIVAGPESATFSLAKCDGRVAPLGVDQLSILARPSNAAKPKGPLTALAKTRGGDVAPGIRRIDSRLVERLETVVDHFRKEAQVAHVALVSGYRPRSAGSYHSTGRALDFRLEGVTNEALVAFCKTLQDTGCGYYPNSLFVHMDVRDPGTGHVSWIDMSRPGEPPKYVSAWPLPADAQEGTTKDATATKDGATKLPVLPADDHSSVAAPESSKARAGSMGLRFF
jgi:hypothetical protein